MNTDSAYRHNIHISNRRIPFQLDVSEFGFKAVYPLKEKLFFVVMLCLSCYVRHRIVHTHTSTGGSGRGIQWVTEGI